MNGFLKKKKSTHRNSYIDLLNQFRTPLNVIVRYRKWDTGVVVVCLIHEMLKPMRGLYGLYSIGDVCELHQPSGQREKQKKKIKKMESTNQDFGGQQLGFPNQTVLCISILIPPGEQSAWGAKQMPGTCGCHPSHEQPKQTYNARPWHSVCPNMEALH